MDLRGRSVDVWPPLPLDEWDDTRATLHLWFQVVGKVRLALEPMVNQWWQVPLYVSGRGLTTSLMHAGGRGVEIEFDFIDHVLGFRTSDGRTDALPPAPMPVAAFHRAVLAKLAGHRDDRRGHPMPSEIADAIPFPQDTVHRAYESLWAERF